MARLVLGAVGAGIGGFMGGSIGASIGWSVGAALGGLVDPPDAIKQQGPRLGDLKLQASSYGAPIPVVYGAVRVAGNVIWASEIRETATTTSEGGKGGPEVETTTYTYAVDVAISIGEGELVGVSRMWANNQLVANFSTTNTDIAESVVFYSGTETQLPDPTMEAALGVGRVPAYRGQAYIVFENLQLADYGNRVPNFEFEVAVGGTFEGPKLVDTGLPAYGGTEFKFIDNLGSIWAYVGTSQISRYNLKSGVRLTTRSIYSSLNTPISANAFLQPSAVSELGTLVCRRAGSNTGNSYLSPSGAEEYTSFRPPPPQPPDPRECQLQLAGAGTGFVVYSDKITVYSVYTSVFVFEEGVNVVSYPGVYSQGFKYTDSAGIAFDNTSAVSLSLTTKRLNISGAAALVLVQPSSISINPFGGNVACKLNSSGLSIFATGEPYINANGIVADSEGNYYVLNTTTKKIHKFLQTSPNAFTNSLTLDTTTVMPSWNPNVKIPSGKKVMVVQYNTSASPTVNGYRIGLIDLVTMSFISSCAAPTNGLQLFESDSGTDIVAGIDSNTNTIKLVNYTPRFTASDDETTASLAAIVSDLCERSGLSASQIDVTALEPYKVRGYALSRQASARANIAQLQQAYFFDAVESDHKIKFVPRTQRPAVTIDADELGAYAAGGQPSELLEVRRGQEVELPSRVSVTYPDQTFDYQLKTQNAQRLLTASVVESAEALAVVLSADEARSVANRALYFAHIERTRFAFGTSKKYLYLEPTDVVTINGPNKSYIARLQTASTSGGLIQWEAIAAAGTGAAINAPVIISPLGAGAVAGVAFAYTILATNTPTSYSATGLPAGLTLNTSTGAITGTVAASGTAVATITATNASGSGKSPLTITTTASAVAPTITSAATINAKVGALVNAFLSATGTSPIAWAVTSGQLPVGLSLNTSTGAITGTPTTEGTASFTVRAANGTAPNATLAMTAIVQASGQSPIDVVVPGATYAQYLDIPLLRDKDDGAGFYVALTAATAPWSGATVLQSADGLSYTSLASAFSSAASGFATTQLGAGFNTNMIDEASSVTVYINGSGTLASITTDELLNGGNACVIGGEILCFGTATLVAAQTYRLSRFIRGLFGTEAAQATHPGGDAFVMLNGGGVVRVAGTTAQIGQPLQYKSITNGQKLNTAAAVPFTNSAAGLKPLSPVLVNASKQPNGDFIVRWTRRGRIDAGWRSTVDVPLGETVEEYDLELYTSGLPNILRRTARVTAPTYTYTLAQQVADAGSGIAAGALSHRVYQISSAVGRGFGSPIANT
jgi:hypothetical protein